ncbi:hypothetical protein AGMMS4956_04770 [Bacteroidia bacterium]|nr:hypothetical protein AGMMS4956_04770 [Bacteroidia bacterium]
MVLDNHIREKERLLQQLKDGCAFWSYEPSSVTINTTSDDLLIEKVLLHLDIDEINTLFTIYPKQHIQEVWEKQMCVHEPRYHRLNVFLALVYFGIKNPGRYIENVHKQHFVELDRKSDEWFSKTYGKSF